MLRKTIDHTISAREEARAQRQAELREKLKRGLLGQKLGKHRVRPGEVDVQLGEELSESLRALKVGSCSVGVIRGVSCSRSCPAA